jgi:hypothetical protein
MTSSVPLNQICAAAPLLHGVADPLGLCRLAVLLVPFKPSLSFYLFVWREQMNGRTHDFPNLTGRPHVCEPCVIIYIPQCLLH